MSATPSNPSDLARETLKTLAMRKIPPTPDSYAKIYAEISGTDSTENNGAEKVLRGIADHLAQAPQSATASIALKKLIEVGDWAQCFKEIEKILPKQGGEITQSWSSLIRDLLRLLEMPHKGLTLTRKKEGLETVLTRFAANPETLFEKLTGLMRSWSESTNVTANAIEVEATPLAPDTPASQVISNTQPSVESGAISVQLLELLAQALESVLTTLPDLTQEGQTLAQQVRGVKTHEQITTVSDLLRQFWIKAKLHGSDQAKIHEGLIRLLRLLVANVGDMIEGEEWLQGQIAILKEIIANPIDKGAITDAERNLRDAILKQGALKKDLTDAKSTLKNLMVNFIDRLGEITESTGDYRQKIEGYSLQISKSNNIAELSHLLDDIMQDTRLVQASAQRSHEDLLSARQKVQESEDKIKKLEHELAQVSELVQEDQLTGALNRRGLDEAFQREATRTDRKKSPLCVALLDIDNFKRLNDTLGHQAGDQALVHLSTVVKEALRPSDSVSRYGGEEFIIILPDVELKAAVETIERLQRELTKKIFLHQNERVLVTFSAGVAQRISGEPQEDVVGRADKAMYQAKKTGKNRVIAAE